MDRTCMDCGVSIAHRGNAAKRCEICGEVANNPRARTERPCKNLSCTEMVQRNGKVYRDYCSDDCKPRCTVDGCEDPQRKKGWCASHYTQWQSTGQVRAFKYKWSRAESCMVCGHATGSIPGLKKYCSWRCAGFSKYHGGSPPTSASCAQCGTPISLDPHANGRRRRCDIVTCSDCQRRYDPRKVMGVYALAQRDGSDCTLCHEPVDLELAWPDLHCATVDHVWPRSRGGSDDPANLQLAHLICNLRKGNKTPEELAAL